MRDPSTLGRYLLIAGFAVALIGGVLMIAGQVPGLRSLGRLPGDLVIRRGPLTVYLPIVSSIVLSLVLTVAILLITRR